ncbi:hypothetical protein QMZ92_35155 [Streptomyces sp. HNM0645]|uniref:hypothetical protein n=1 Tax=Streptomyces sp. HNM0645 TaxID=2782343 RepID=UPI0024B6C896|nr:hypothetical protein [Streptomyces sp. HNM0645]MDI9889409.1 hypothetical protein [Streptomyces sp. HNM0645]
MLGDLAGTGRRGGGLVLGGHRVRWCRGVEPEAGGEQVFDRDQVSALAVLDRAGQCACLALLGGWCAVRQCLLRAARLLYRSRGGGFLGCLLTVPLGQYHEDAGTWWMFGGGPAHTLSPFGAGPLCGCIPADTCEIDCFDVGVGQVSAGEIGSRRDQSPPRRIDVVSEGDGAVAGESAADVEGDVADSGSLAAHRLLIRPTSSAGGVFPVPHAATTEARSPLAGDSFRWCVQGAYGGFYCQGL